MPRRSPCTRTLLALAALAAAFSVVVSLSTPAAADGYVLLGESIGLGQRDFRVFNNFSDAAANDNTTPHVNFPGHTGAVMAIWKGVAEWGSVWRGGDGAGDPTQPRLGTGGANFDSTFQGAVDDSGDFNANTFSALNQNMGGVFAFTVFPIADGWKIRFYDMGRTWSDGPDVIPGDEADIQGTACHEYGHALGLNHSSVAGSTMLAFTALGAITNRSISPDDVAGVQAIYGVADAAKPEITGLAGALTPGSLLTITGVDFDDDDNDVWFTRADSDGVPEKIFELPSTNGAGTEIVVTIPANAIDGDVLVKNGDTTGGKSLSNAWPLDIDEGGVDPAVLGSIFPTAGPQSGFDTVTLTGSGFTGVTDVLFGANPVLAFTIDADTQITVTTPPGPFGSSVDVTVEDPDGDATLPAAYTYGADPLPDIASVTPGSAPASGGASVTVAGPSVIGVTDVTFGGVSGSNLAVTSATSLDVDVPGGIGTVDVVAIGTGSDTLAGGFSYADVGGFVDLGPGVGGALGAPTLTGAGDQTPGSNSGFELSIGNSPLDFGIWFWAFGPGATAPFKQGTFYPIPILLQIAFVMPAADVTFPVVWGAALPNGVQFTLQWWVVDATAPAGVSGSNGLRLDVP